LACVGRSAAGQRNPPQALVGGAQGARVSRNRDRPCAAAQHGGQPQLDPRHRRQPRAYRSAGRAGKAARRRPAASWSSRAPELSWPSRASSPISVCANCASCNWPRPRTRHHPRSGQPTHRSRGPSVGCARQLLLLPATAGGGKCGRLTSANEIDQILRTVARAWPIANAPGWLPRRSPSAQVWPGRVASLRNQIARAMGYSSFFGLHVADYGNDRRRGNGTHGRHAGGQQPLYDGLHCLQNTPWPDRYKKSVPKFDSGALAGQSLGAGMARLG